MLYCISLHYHVAYLHGLHYLNTNLFREPSSSTTDKEEGKPKSVSFDSPEQSLSTSQDVGPGSPIAKAVASDKDATEEEEKFSLKRSESTLENHKPSESDRADFNALTRFYDKWVNPIHEKIRNMIAQGAIRFDAIWALFKPGELLYSRDDFDEPCLFVISACEFRGARYATVDFLDKIFGNTPRDRFVVDAWANVWDGATKTFSRQNKTFVIHAFPGTRPITSLEIYPTAFYKAKDGTDGATLCQEMERRGRLWKDLVSGKPCCKYYDGPAKEMTPALIVGVIYEEPRNLNARVIVDQDGYKLQAKSEAAGFDEIMKPMRKMFSGMSGKELAVSLGGYTDKFVDFDGYAKDRDFTTLQAQVCPSTVHCYEFLTRRWYAVTMGPKRLKDVEWEKAALDHLVLDEQIKGMLHGLVEQHKKNSARVIRDVIQGKGKGLVVVLHGPPGVGKTLTAESVAEHTQKPLLTINIGELTAEEHIVSRLQNVFLQASHWDAVLLLDEADVVLEQRSFEDLKRNGIVSVFLRMLEYYEGILFLTTNRLGTIDVAFRSRIHIAVRYEPLSEPAKRQIWKNFIERIDKSEVDGKAELREHLDDIATWPLNGREVCLLNSWSCQLLADPPQIRNVLSIAQSIAYSEGRRRGALRYEHVERTANETIKFQDYFKKMDADNRASLQGAAPGRQFQQKWAGSSR